jgi:hypothetical protein
MMKTSMSQTQRLAKYLSSKGRTISAPQAEALFGIKNLSARVSDLRKAGFKVVLTENRAGKSAYKIVR